MSDEIKAILPTSPSYTVGSTADEARREKQKKQQQLPENETTEEPEEDTQTEKKQPGLFDEFV